MKGVIVDTSVWVDHFRRHNTGLVALLALDLVMVHPLVVAEIACGTPPNRAQTLMDLKDLRHTQQASVQEVIDLIEREKLFGQGCGVVDLTLLALTLLTPAAELWTLDTRLASLAERFGVMHQATLH